MTDTVHSNTRFDVYRTVTEKIGAAFEAGAGHFFSHRRPQARASMPVAARSGECYFSWLSSPAEIMTANFATDRNA